MCQVPFSFPRIVFTFRKPPTCCCCGLNWGQVDNGYADVTPGTTTQHTDIAQPTLAITTLHKSLSQEGEGVSSYGETTTPTTTATITTPKRLENSSSHHLDQPEEGIVVTRHVEAAKSTRSIAAQHARQTQKNNRVPRCTESTAVPDVNQTANMIGLTIPTQGHPQLQDPGHAETGPGTFSGAGRFIVKELKVDERDTGRAMASLEKHTIRGAEFDSSARSSPPQCHPDTRKAIVEKTCQWFSDTRREKRILWMVGPAGVGKSAIMQTLAEQAAGSPDLKLGATLFLSRPNGRSNPLKVFITLAYQIALVSPPYRDFIVREVTDDPRLQTKSMETQFRRLFVEPFSHQVVHQGSGDLLIFLDGLDECEGAPAQCEIVKLISSFALAHPNAPLVWIIASRPESHLKAIFSRKTIVPSYEEEEVPIDSDEVSIDVERYLRVEFERIQQNDPIARLRPQWPTESEFLTITAAGRGSFAFASAVINFVGDPTYKNPISGLALLLAAINKIPLQRRAQPLAYLDALYSHILSQVPKDVLPATYRVSRNDPASLQRTGHSDEASADMETYLRTEFTRIQQHDPTARLLPQWPMETEFLTITAAARGSFAFASTAIKFVGDPIHKNLNSALAQLVAATNSVSLQPSKEGPRPFAYLDALYTCILSRIPGGILPDTISLLVNHRVLRNHLVSALPELAFLCSWIGISPNDAYSALDRLRSVLTIPPPEQTEREGFSFQHQSFYEYLSDPERSRIFHISKADMDRQELDCSLRILKAVHRGHSIFPISTIGLSWPSMKAGESTREDLYNHAAWGFMGIFDRYDADLVLSKFQDPGIAQIIKTFNFIDPGRVGHREPLLDAPFVREDLIRRQSDPKIRLELERLGFLHTITVGMICHDHIDKGAPIYVRRDDDQPAHAGMDNLSLLGYTLDTSFAINPRSKYLSSVRPVTVPDKRFVLRELQHCVVDCPDAPVLYVQNTRNAHLICCFKPRNGGSGSTWIFCIPYRPPEEGLDRLPM